MSTSILPASFSLPNVVNAYELPPGISPVMVAVAVGLFTGLAVFGLVALIAARTDRARRPAIAAGANDLVFIPPYPTLSGSDPSSSGAIVLRAAPSEPSVGGTGVHAGVAPAHAAHVAPVPLARMGFAFGERIGAPVVPLGANPHGAAPHATMTRREDSGVIETGPASPIRLPAVLPSAMRSASFEALVFDDDPTEFGEPRFDA